jgi:hypothetical protein
MFLKMQTPVRQVTKNNGHSECGNISHCLVVLPLKCHAVRRHNTLNKLHFTCESAYKNKDTFDSSSKALSAHKQHDKYVDK